MFKLLIDAYNAWSTDNASRLGAALAYYTVFSLAPLLIMVISISGLVFGTEAAQAELFARMETVVGVNSAQYIGSLIDSAHHSSATPEAAIIGALTLLVGALGIFGQLQDAFNTIWPVPPQPGFRFGLRRLLKE